MKTLAATLVVVLSVVMTTAQDSKPAKTDAKPDCTMHQQHSADTHHAMVEKHGDQAMGFAHDKTRHHFRLHRDGGLIEVRANNPNDQDTAAAIRLHLSHIATLFANGDFSAPMFIHGLVVPGVTTMQLLRRAIRYQYEESATGGRVYIESNDPIGVAAIHDFLRFQITDHQTGDSLTVENAH